ASVRPRGTSRIFPRSRASANLSSPPALSPSMPRFRGKGGTHGWKHHHHSAADRVDRRHSDSDRSADFELRRRGLSHSDRARGPAADFAAVKNLVMAALIPAM